MDATNILAVVGSIALCIAGVALIVWPIACRILRDAAERREDEILINEARIRGEIMTVMAGEALRPGQPVMLRDGKAYPAVAVQRFTRRPAAEGLDCEDCG